MNRARRLATWVHRYVGLAIAGFLMLNGLSGAVLAWADPLDRLLAPAFWTLPPEAAARPPLDLVALHDRAEAATGFAIAWIDWTRPPGAPQVFALSARPGEPEPHVEEVAVDPGTGRILAQRSGDLRRGAVDLVPFLRHLHHQLALGARGTAILGVVALAWVVQSLTGAYLTFPPRTRATARPWLRRWKPAWLVRTRAGRLALFHDLHRAGGLWPWALMLVMATSALSFTWPALYQPVMRTLLGLEPSAPPPRSADPRVPPRLDWRAAHARARGLAADLARRERLTILSERLMLYEPAAHAYTYRVRSDRDVASVGNTRIRFDGDSGALLAVRLPTGRAAGTTLTAWITSVHLGRVAGVETALRILLSAFGLTVAMLSGTGMWLWWRRRRGRRRPARRGAAIA